MQDKSTFSTTDELSDTDFEKDETGEAEEAPSIEPDDESRFAVDLEPTLRRMNGLIREMERSSIAARYLLGREVLAVQQNATYGDNAVDYLAIKLNVSTRTLRTHARVVSVFDDQAKFDAVTNADRPAARPMTWAHMVELASADDAVRETLTRRALDEGLSVAALRQLKSEVAVAAVATQNATPALSSRSIKGAAKPRAAKPAASEATHTETSSENPQGENVAPPQLVQAVRRTVELALAADREACLQVIEALRTAANELETRLGSANIEATT
jgi:hypothetical protein